MVHSNMPAIRWYASFLWLMSEIQSLIRLQKKGNNGSLIAHLLEEHDATGGSADDVEIIKEVAATVYAGRSIFSDCQILKPK